MPKIIELDPHVADLIAAGEVVERPASVVKELIENSIDAGAGIITVEITAGGMTYIRVTDNGCGIAPEDAKTAFLRHATSKLRSADGLEAIGTLGFRGEALAAISAVSRIDLLTREPGASEGVSLSLEAGVVTDTVPAGCPEGTTIIIRDLFFNTPARLKFMKSDRAESSAVASAVLRCALSRPDVSIRFIRDGKTEYHTPGDSRVDSCIYSLFGRDFLAGLTQANSSDESVAVTGFVSMPAAARGNRSYQFFFVNGRPIQSRMLQAALEQAYANTLPSGRYPSCALYIKTRLSDVDVNVHPAKTEVKFISDKQVFDGVYYAALGAPERSRSGTNAECRMQNAELTAPTATGRSATWQSGRSSGQYSQLHGSPVSDNKSAFKSMQVDDYRKAYSSDGARPRSSDSSAASGGQLSEYRPQLYTPHSTFPQTPPMSSETPDATSFAQYSTLTPSSFRVIGEALNTYIIIEYRDSVWFIDKHAAHERIHFDALKSEGATPLSQALITPVICRHGAQDAELLLENSDLLESLGFSVESFGDDAVAVRNIPADIDLADTESILSDICTELNHSGKAEPAWHDNIFRTIACKAAIKAGKASGMRELETLAARVMSGEISHCPHGRPVAFEITKTALDKSFKRI